MAAGCGLWQTAPVRLFELWIGLRYTRAKRRNHFISFISLVSMLGIALGVMALIVVMAVMNGFQHELRARILGVAAHMEISGPAGQLDDWPRLARAVANYPGVLGSAPYVNAQGLLAAGGETRGALIRGVSPAHEPGVTDVAQHMRLGRLEDLEAGAFRILLGSELARILGVSLGERVTLIAPQGMVTPAGMLPRMRAFTVAGVFEMGMYEYDAGLALIHLEDAQRLYRLGEAVSGLRLRLADMDRAPWLTRELVKNLEGDYFVSDWTMSHATFFRAVQIEKRMMFIILTLIVAVAAFNIVSTLVMVVTDKLADIAILRTLGASPGSIMVIFMVQGSVIGVIGTALGVASGVTLALNLGTLVPWLERALGFDLFPADVYYISELPSRLAWGDVVWVSGVALTLAFFATIYPSVRAARVQPAEALRYE